MLATCIYCNFGQKVSIMRLRNLIHIILVLGLELIIGYWLLACAKGLAQANAFLRS